MNYQDENLNISIPVFSIHGNHDDPTGVIIIVIVLLHYKDTEVESCIEIKFLEITLVLVSCSTLCVNILCISRNFVNK